MRKLVPAVRHLEIDMGNGFNATVKMMLPPNIDESGNHKHPLLVDVYGGPDSNQVSSKFELGWGSYLVSSKSYIYVRIDGRGSGNRGDAILNQIYRSLGTVELEDQISVTK